MVIEEVRLRRSVRILTGLSEMTGGDGEKLKACQNLTGEDDSLR